VGWGGVGWGGVRWGEGGRGNESPIFDAKGPFAIPPPPLPPQVPRPLEEAVRHSLELVTAPHSPSLRPHRVEAAGGGRLGLSFDGAVWDSLAACLADRSVTGGRIGRGWLLRLLAAAADQEVAST
jgi:hypothetical protein